MPGLTKLNIVLQNNDRTIAALAEHFGAQVTKRIGGQTLESVFIEDKGWINISEINQQHAAQILKQVTYPSLSVVGG